MNIRYPIYEGVYRILTVYTGIMPLRHSRIIAAAASSVTAGLQMLAMDFCFMSLLFL